MRQSISSTVVDLLGARDELHEIRLPHRASSSETASRVERTLDNLVEMLAEERSRDIEPIAPSRVDLVPTVVPAVAQELLDLSIVMPCLNDARTVDICVGKAIEAIATMGIRGEVVVADRGSRDRSVEIAEAAGARVVQVDQSGYGAAIMGGVDAARGKFVLLGDADNSYDFSQAHRFYRQLSDGAEFVQGCRLPSGGGRVMPGAMPWLHQYGNPALSWLVQKMFRAPVQDVYCGMRAFTKDLYQRIDPRCTGRELATELTIKSKLFGANIAEVPIVLHSKARQANVPHSQSFQDGWKTLRFFSMFSPRWTFLTPGLIMGVAGLLGCMAAMLRLNVLGVAFEAHTLLVSMVALLVGVQVASFAILAKSFAASQGVLPADARVEAFSNRFTLERTLCLSALMVVGGTTVAAWKSLSWVSAGFGSLDYSETMRWMVPAVGVVALGVQFAFSRMMLNILSLARR